MLVVLSRSVVVCWWAGVGCTEGAKPYTMDVSGSLAHKVGKLKVVTSAQARPLSFLNR